MPDVKLFINVPFISQQKWTKSTKYQHISELKKCHEYKKDKYFEML